jgi:hypothetical protein
MSVARQGLGERGATLLVLPGQKEGSRGEVWLSLDVSVTVRSLFYRVSIGEPTATFVICNLDD